MGLLDMHLLVVLAFPLLDEQQLVGVGLGEIVVIAQAAVLCPDGGQNTGFGDLADKSLSLFGQAGKFDLDGIDRDFPPVW